MHPTNQLGVLCKRDDTIYKQIFLSFFRGEKLYVTKDNREMRHNNCRSVVCITVVVLFLAAAVAVATLIGGKFSNISFGYCTQLGSWVRYPKEN